MAQFFKFVLATIVGILLLMAIIIGLFVAAVAVGGKQESKTEDNSVLKLSLNVPISERSQENPLEDFDLPFATPIELKTIGLLELRQAIARAKEDAKIKGIYLDAGNIQAGWATLEEIRQALQDFKQSGKFIYAYSETISEPALYVISVADSIFLHPQGSIEFNGLVAEIGFAKGLFEKIGVKPEIFRVGEFKSAVEPFMLDKMSQANRLQVTAYLNSIYNHYLQGISQSRHIPVEQLKQIADGMLVQLPREAAAYNLISRTAYYDEVENLIRAKLGIDQKKKINFISLKRYAKEQPTEEPGSYSKKRIAVIFGEGSIRTGKGGQDQIGSETIAEELRKARQEDKVAAVVLRINSPGGSALASDVMWREVVETKKKKPVIASMSDVAASGGYYMAMGCNKIFAHSTTITGSIGIFGLLFDASKLLSEKIGITFDRVETSQFADLGNPTKKFTDQERQIIQRSVNEGYETFTSKAAAGRNMPLDTLKKYAGGRVWTGEQALKIGLIDQLGGLEEAIKAAAKEAGLKEGEYVVRYYPAKKSFLEALQSVSDQMEEQQWKQRAGSLYPLIKQIKELVSYQGVQARLPYEVNIH
ncbi:MAG: signal peptide peptidase SppA [Cytophagales bacterium]|nr:signal peptide peptidase SppA [Bernardetiaceae bacterium]MDW8210220.1 signal peptide peptidase SppA [Cytophagales bacterium]